MGRLLLFVGVDLSFFFFLVSFHFDIFLPEMCISVCDFSL